jgi:hypothetical protein
MAYPGAEHFCHPADSTAFSKHINLTLLFPYMPVTVLNLLKVWLQTAPIAVPHQRVGA